jgi:uncharacterized membrane protein YebE (DUF533 family)
MLDPKKLLDELLGANVPGGQESWRDKATQATQLARDNPVATGALAAILLGTSSGRRVSGAAVRIGGLAAIAGLAYKAYQNYQTGNPPSDARDPDLPPPPEETSFHPSRAPQGEDQFALALVRAMVAAARSDGHIDDGERRKIADQLKLSALDAEEESFVVSELERPVDLDALITTAETDAQKVELYTASRLAIDAKSRAERGYLEMLAGRLKLPGTLVDHVEATVKAAQD